MYVVNQELVVVYQALNAESGLGTDLKYDVYDETHTLDPEKSGTTMTEMGTTGRYYATFTPDVVGVWTVQIEKISDSKGKTTARFDVRAVGEVLQQEDILSDATPFAGAMIATIRDFVDCLPEALGDLVGKNLVNVLSDEQAFAGANIDAAITTRATPAEILVEVANKIDGAKIDEAISSRAPAGEYDTELTSIEGKIDELTTPAQAM